MKTYIAIATEEERGLISDFFHLFPTKKCQIIVTGVGGANVIESLNKLKKNSRIINVGYVGSNNLKIGTKLQVKTSHLYHHNCHYKSPLYILNDEGFDCYTSTDFVTLCKIKKDVVFDMELAFICAMGFKEVLSYKVVSDNLRYKDYEKNSGNHR